MSGSRAILFVAAFVAASGFDHPAHAYLDPGTGSIVLQLLLGGAAGALVVTKLYWARIKSLFGRKPRDESADHKSERSQ